MRSLAVYLSGLMAALHIGGCASPNVGHPETRELPYPAHWLAQTSDRAPQGWAHVGPQQDYLPELSSQQSLPTSYDASLVHPAMQQAPGLSPGDRVRIWLPGSRWDSGFFDDHEATFSGIYEIGMNGYLKLPHLPAIPAYGTQPHELEALINTNLEHHRIFRPGMARASITVQEWAPVTVFVNGAVFNDGQVVIHGRNPQVPNEPFNTQGQMLALDRKLSAALRSAGGVRPDADISRIEIVRATGTITVDLRGLTTGFPAQDPSLMHGDFIRVPSIGLPQEHLIAPSPITPPGLRVFISNLTVPAENNASSAVGPHATSLPYGSRLHTAAVSGNCAGGTAATNSARRVVLVTQDPMRQTPVTIEREIEDLLRSAYNPQVNPYLMPNDSVVCYDSEITNLRDIARTIGEILFPLPLFR